MTENSARSQTFSARRELRSGFIFLGCITIALGGCGVRRRPAIPWATAVEVRPIPQANKTTASEIPEDPVPELRYELPPFPPHLSNGRTAPPRPHVNAPSNAGSETEKPDAPMIAAQLTPAETMVAQQQTNQSLARAERNLAATKGKSLNEAQADLVSKIKGFVKDAREAAQIGDWSRARSLAKKAQVLSEELAGSL
jgi:hypothetical protein